MLRSGRQYLESLDDGRVVFIGGERVRDVVSHAGFSGAARTIAALFDLKHDPAHRATMSVTDGEGAPYSAYFLAPRALADLERRRRCHQLIAESTYGLCGRSPDHVASMITGLAMEAHVLAREGRAFDRNIVDYHRSVKERDAYVVYAVLPERGAARSNGQHRRGLGVVEERDDGLVISGVKAVATAAVYADEVWVGNLQPISGREDTESLTCVVPCSAPGLQIWARRPFALSATRAIDSPLAWRFDESDATLVFDNVHVGWDQVFVHRDPARSAEIYIQSPAHCMANHQSAIRSLAKLRVMIGLAHRIAGTARDLSTVRTQLGQLASLEAILSGLIVAQIQAAESWPSGGVAPDRRYVYAALNLCQEMFPSVVASLRELTGSGVFRLPADASVLQNAATQSAFSRYWGPAATATEDMLVQRLVWEFIGSEFAGRQQQYEMFYAGGPAVVRNHNYREAPWAVFDRAVVRILAEAGGEPAST